MFYWELVVELLFVTLFVTLLLFAAICSFLYLPRCYTVSFLFLLLLLLFMSLCCDRILPRASPSSQVSLFPSSPFVCCSAFFDSGSATIPNRRYLRLPTVAVDVRHHIQRVFAEICRFIVVHPLIFLHSPAFFHFHPHFHYSSAFIVNLSSTALPSSFVVQLQRSESVVCVLYPTAFICRKLLQFLLTHGYCSF